MKKIFINKNFYVTTDGKVEMNFTCSDKNFISLMTRFYQMTIDSTEKNFAWVLSKNDNNFEAAIGDYQSTFLTSEEELQYIRHRYS